MPPYKGDRRSHRRTRATADEAYRDADQHRARPRLREAALVRALKERWIAGACLDVFEHEPLPEGSELWSLPNVIVTPHNSGFSPLQMERQMSIFVDNLARLVAGKPLRNRVLRAGGL